MSIPIPELSRTPITFSEGPQAFFPVEYEPATGEVVMLEQRKLPSEVTYHRYDKPDQVADAIRDMVVRGAPAIGIAAAYALVMVARTEEGDAASFLVANGAAGRVLNATRPTAVNLAWAIARMGRKAAEVAKLDPRERYEAMRAEAEAIHREDVLACHAMGELGARDVPDGATILTHCNAGALATGGYGTALGVIRAAHAAGKKIRVLADETRPYLQGARLTSWELHVDGIPVEVISDNMAGHFFQRGEIDFVVVGSDRIAANGDVANKIGTYSVAVLAKEHGVPFTVAAPWSTVDLTMSDGSGIPIEERPRDEVARVGGTTLVADGIGVRHPAFDVTPGRLVHAVYTERGVFHPAKGEGPSALQSKG
ncbi:MAG: S-methyl-5-thioribose-1-phosphate isomerase [Sandaracinus sp.]|nr:S-methyl-5-thioribose-1-phosphate isomerase [Sandaracinus sp.]|tara:strand:+ start:2252 stop:3355 length:1104 start_codon:yes stop_codon:yes gene_type:complete